MCDQLSTNCHPLIARGKTSAARAGDWALLGSRTAMLVRNGCVGDWRLGDKDFMASFRLPTQAEKREILMEQHPFPREKPIVFDEAPHTYTVDDTHVVSRLRHRGASPVRECVRGRCKTRGDASKKHVGLEAGILSHRTGGGHVRRSDQIKVGAQRPRATEPWHAAPLPR